MPDAVDIRFLFHDGAIPPPMLARGGEILSCDELARFKDIGDAGRARDFFLARLLARTALSERMPAVTPQAWRFGAGPAGKPFAEPAGDGRIFCNWSHTEGLVACAVANTGEVGIDVEALMGTPRDWCKLSRRFFADGERTRLAEAGWRHADCLRLWTAKESVIKALGGGMLRDARALELTPDGGEWRVVSLDMPESPRITALAPGAGWVGAVTVMGADAAALRVQVRSARVETLAE